MSDCLVLFVLSFAEYWMYLSLHHGWTNLVIWFCGVKLHFQLYKLQDFQLFFVDMCEWLFSEMQRKKLFTGETPVWTLPKTHKIV